MPRSAAFVFNKIADDIGNMDAEQTAKLAGLIVAHISVDRETVHAFLAELSDADRGEFIEQASDYEDETEDDDDDDEA